MRLMAGVLAKEGGTFSNDLKLPSLSLKLSFSNDWNSALTLSFYLDLLLTDSNWWEL
jgi:hypothetical protein